MSERKAGWYWIKQNDEWTPTWWDVETGAWWDEATLSLFSDEATQAIGPRIPTPDEIEDMVIMPRSVYEFLLEQKREFKAREWNPERTEFINGMERRVPEKPIPPTGRTAKY